MKLGKLFVALLSVFVFTAELGHAQRSQTIVISYDNGGNLVKYAQKVSRARVDNVQVKFNGRCASACTLYLSLSPSQTCITRGAKFLFHRAYGARSDVNAWGTRYMVEKYPQWVRSWISQNGGLTHQPLEMSYSYASKHLRKCNSA